MNSNERFHATIERKPVDRPAFWLGLPVADAIPALLRHFGAADLRDLYVKAGDDVYPIEFPYHSPAGDAIYMAFDWTGAGKQDDEHRTLGGEGFFANCEDVTKVTEFPWPDPARYIDRNQCRRNAEAAPPGRANLGMIWSCHFQDACASFGMENALIALYERPEVFRAVMDRITDFYLRANGIFYEATKGKLHAVLMGNDYGCQTGLMLSREQIAEFALPWTRKLVDQAHAHGLKVIHHSCGAIRDLIPDLITLGVDAIHPIQALAKGMEATGLKRDFGDKVSFCGGIDAQELLVHGTPAQMRAKVRELRGLFPTGLILSPSHEAILPDVPRENIAAMVEAALAH
jgi:uroporphyrinogen decarboxylase